ncbi:Sigma-adaptin 3A [Allomyces arbusculus]|nr:Sigma-adaptin 3A [Allomyces arbusculus]
MIHAVLAFNTAGKPRLVKFYGRVGTRHQALLLRTIADLVLARPKDACNFLDPCSAAVPVALDRNDARSDQNVANDDDDDFDNDPDNPRATTASAPHASSASARDTDAALAALLPLTAATSTRAMGAPLQLTVVYRIYATLCFAMVVDAAESELAILDLIQVLVEAMDAALGPNVCELDLVFHFDDAHAVLAEMIQAGLVLETSVTAIVANYKATMAHAKASKATVASGLGAAAAAAVSAFPRAGRSRS